jgi:hypothetical protein
MNVAQLSPPFYSAYFGALDAALKQTTTLSDVTRILYDASARRDGRQSLQFSFATKLLHMTNPVLPICDSQIAGFYFFQETTTSLNLQQRINGFVAFHDFRESSSLGCWRRRFRNIAVNSTLSMSPTKRSSIP